MCEVFVGPALKDYSNVASMATDSALKTFEYEPKGEGTEAFVQWVFSLFSGVSVIPTEKGNKLDLMGLDFLFRGQSGPTLGIQVKSSEAGVHHFKNNGDLSESIVLLWVNCKSAESRKELFLSIAEFVQPYGGNLSQQVEELIDKAFNFCNHISLGGIPIDKRGRATGFNSQEVALLLRLGLIVRQGNKYVMYK